MIARKLPAARGLVWLLAGLRLFRRNPPLVSAATLLYLLAVQLIALLPVVGPILLPLLLPTATLAVANVCRLVDRGEMLSRAALTRGIQGNGPLMLRLGGLQLVGALLLLLVNSLLAGGEDPFSGLMEPTGSDEPPPLGAFLRLMLTALPLFLAFWFAPFLTGWERVPPVKSLFFSSVASLRNWSALAVFSMAALFVAGIVPALILILVAQTFGMALDAIFIALRLFLVFFVAPVLSAAVYVSYLDIFRASDEPS